MKKKVAKKSRAARSVASKRVGKKAWYKALPFKFSIVSVAILGCLTLVAGGVYHFALKNNTHVLAAKVTNQACIYFQNGCYEGRGVIGIYPEGSSKSCSKIPLPSEFPQNQKDPTKQPSCPSRNTPIYVQIINRTGGPITLYSAKIKMTVKQEPGYQHTEPVPSKGGIMRFYDYTGYLSDAGTIYNNITFTPQAESPYYFASSKPIQTYSQAFSSPYKNCGSRSKPCTFLLYKKSAPRVLPTPKPKPVCPSSKGICISAQACHGYGGKANSAYSCSNNTVCCTN